ncbi:MAG: hypothetical protein ACSLFD_04745 [Solirubrobacterales bacterium]
MKKLPLLLTLVLVIASSVVFVACGGDDSSSDDSGEAVPTKAEFIAQADEICAAGDQAINDAGTEQFGDKMPSEDKLADFASETVIPNIEQQLADLRELTPPEGDEDTVNSVWDSLDEGIATLEEDPAAGFGDDNPFEDANQQAQAYGFEACGDS